MLRSFPPNLWAKENSTMANKDSTTKDPIGQQDDQTIKSVFIENLGMTVHQNRRFRTYRTKRPTSERVLR